MLQLQTFLSVLKQSWPCQALLCASKPYWALAFWLSAAINASRATVLRVTQPRRPRQADPSDTWMAIYSHQAPSDQRWSAPKMRSVASECACAQGQFCLIERGESTFTDGQVLDADLYKRQKSLATWAMPDMPLSFIYHSLSFFIILYHSFTHSFIGAFVNSKRTWIVSTG